MAAISLSCCARHKDVATSESASASPQAASIAALIGGKSAKTALKLGQKLFRALPLDQLTEEDLTDNRDTGLFARTVTLHLGECDAFFSHSWRDDGTAKYAALTNWAETRRATLAVRPSIWLDKACIDQTSIDENLAALPVFLAGCKKLLITAGETYPTRLWCVMECFTFLFVTGKDLEENLIVYRLGSGIQDILSNFDAAHASCYHSRDRDRLLGIIESGYGDLNLFTLLMRGMLSSAAAGRGSIQIHDATLEA